MRLGEYAECAKCGYQWEYETGIGYFNAIYHCNKCGKEKGLKYDTGEICVDLSNECGFCECGGTFCLDNDCIICPKCRNKMPNEGLERMFWD